MNVAQLSTVELNELMNELYGRRRDGGFRNYITYDKRNEALASIMGVSTRVIKDMVYAGVDLHYSEGTGTLHLNCCGASKEPLRAICESLALVALSAPLSSVRRLTSLVDTAQEYLTLNGAGSTTSVLTARLTIQAAVRAYIVERGQVTEYPKKG